MYKVLPRAESMMPEELKYRAMRVWGLKNLGRPIYIEQTVLSGRRKPLPLPPSTKTFLENGAEVIYDCRANGTQTLYDKTATQHEQFLHSPRARAQATSPSQSQR